MSTPENHTLESRPEESGIQLQEQMIQEFYESEALKQKAMEAFVVEYFDITETGLQLNDAGEKVLEEAQEKFEIAKSVLEGTLYTNIEFEDMYLMLLSLKYPNLNDFIGAIDTMDQQIQDNYVTQFFDISTTPPTLDLSCQDFLDDAKRLYAQAQINLEGKMPFRLELDDVQLMLAYQKMSLSTTGEDVSIFEGEILRHAERITRSQMSQIDESIVGSNGSFATQEEFDAFVNNPEMYETQDSNIENAQETNKFRAFVKRTRKFLSTAVILVKGSSVFAGVGGQAPEMKPIESDLKAKMEYSYDAAALQDLKKQDISGAVDYKTIPLIGGDPDDQEENFDTPNDLEAPRNNEVGLFTLYYITANPSILDNLENTESIKQQLELVKKALTDSDFQRDNPGAKAIAETIWGIQIEEIDDDGKKIAYLIKEPIEVDGKMILISIDSDFSDNWMGYMHKINSNILNSSISSPQSLSLILSNDTKQSFEFKKLPGLNVNQVKNANPENRNNAEAFGPFDEVDFKKFFDTTSHQKKVAEVLKTFLDTYSLTELSTNEKIGLNDLKDAKFTAKPVPKGAPLFITNYKNSNLDVNQYFMPNEISDSQIADGDVEAWAKFYNKPVSMTIDGKILYGQLGIFGKCANIFFMPLQPELQKVPINLPPTKKIEQVFWAHTHTEKEKIVEAERLSFGGFGASAGMGLPTENEEMGQVKAKHSAGINGARTDYYTAGTEAEGITTYFKKNGKQGASIQTIQPDNSSADAVLGFQAHGRTVEIEKNYSETSSQDLDTYEVSYKPLQITQDIGLQLFPLEYDLGDQRSLSLGVGANIIKGESGLKVEQIKNIMGNIPDKDRTTHFQENYEFENTIASALLKYTRGNLSAVLGAGKTIVNVSGQETIWKFTGGVQYQVGKGRVLVGLDMGTYLQNGNMNPTGAVTVGFKIK